VPQLSGGLVFLSSSNSQNPHSVPFPTAPQVVLVKERCVQTDFAFFRGKGHGDGLSVDKIKYKTSTVTATSQRGAMPCVYMLSHGGGSKLVPSQRSALMGTPTDFWLASFGWLDPDRSGQKRQRRRPQRPPHMHTSAGPCAAGARGRRSGGRSRWSGAQRQKRTVRSVRRRRNHFGEGWRLSDVCGLEGGQYGSNVNHPIGTREAGRLETSSNVSDCPVWTPVTLIRSRAANADRPICGGSRDGLKRGWF
jgi:hypothetical protein